MVVAPRRTQSPRRVATTSAPTLTLVCRTGSVRRARSVAADGIARAISAQPTEHSVTANGLPT